MLQIFFLVVGLVGGLIHSFVICGKEALVIKIEILLVWMVFWWFGAFCLAGAWMHYKELGSTSGATPPHIPFE